MNKPMNLSSHYVTVGWDGFCSIAAIYRVTMPRLLYLVSSESLFTCISLKVSFLVEQANENAYLYTLIHTLQLEQV